MLVALGMLAQDVLGGNPSVTGLPCSATAPASLSVVVGAGHVYTVGAVDTTAYSTAGTNAQQVLKQGYLLGNTTLACGAPSNVGNSIIYLVECQYADIDINQVVLPYVNPTAGGPALSGVNGNNVPQPTTRNGTISLQTKAGTQATTGTQAAPIVDTGWLPLYTVTIAYGQTQILASNIQVHPAAPFLPASLQTAINQTTGDARYLKQYAQTARESAASILPINLTYQSGPLRYGAAGDGVTADNVPWTKMGSFSDIHNIQNGTYLFAAKVAVNGDFNWRGAGRTTTVIQSAGFSDYVLEIGTSPTPPNVSGGRVCDLTFRGGTSVNKGMIHMGKGANLWRLDDLYFPYNACPALIIDGVEDSFYSNLDIYGGYTGGTPQSNASVQVINQSNNIYLPDFHVEQCPSGALYIGPNSGPVKILGGKLDQGFIAQTGDGIYCDMFSQLWCENFQMAGTGGNVFAITTLGSVWLNNNIIGGGGGGPALIRDLRSWAQINGVNDPTVTDASYGPTIGTLDLGNTTFTKSNYSVFGNTKAAVLSKIPGYRQVNSLAVTYGGIPSGATTMIATSLTAASNDIYKGSYLVYNNQGTVASPGNSASRRLILNSFTNGQMLVQGAWSAAVSSDCSIEYCGGHFTPNLRADGITLDSGMTLFAILDTGVTVNGTPYYTASSSAGGIAGCTTCNITTNLATGTDLTGYYLVDEVTGEAYLIAYGLDGSNNMAVPYNRVNFGSHTYSIVAGYSANAKNDGTSLEWTFAGKKKTALLSALIASGFDQSNIPIWGFGTTGEPISLPYSTLITLDASQAHEATITATNATAFGINAPLNLCSGDRIIYTIRNTSGGALGTVTWNSIFKMASWTSPATANSRSIEFRYDGTNLVEINRTSADIPN